MKKILIIGGTRFLGPSLIKLLHTKSYDITVFNRGNSYGVALPKYVKQIHGDRRDTSTMIVLLGVKYDIIYDLCCFNETDAANLLNYIQPPKHIVFLSTTAVYKKPLTYPLSEDAQLGEWDSFGMYGTNKAMAEKLFATYAKKHHIKITVFRPVYLLGKNNYFDRENYYFSRITNGNPILVPGRGDALIQFAFLKETAIAFAEIPEKQKTQIETLNVAGNDYISVKDFVHLCGNIVGKQPKIIELNSKKYGLVEDHFYDDFYPFPNLTFIASNKKITGLYKHQFQSLRDGMKEIYSFWKKSWNGKTKHYPLELETLNKLHAI